jgi:predicted amidohydrolase
LPRGAPIRIALYQSIAHSGDTAAQLATLRRVAGEVRGRADLLACSELYMTGYKAGVATLHRLAEAADGPFAQAASAIAAENGLAIVYTCRASTRRKRSARATG